MGAGADDLGRCRCQAGWRRPTLGRVWAGFDHEAQAHNKRTHPARDPGRELPPKRIQPRAARVRVRVVLAVAALQAQAVVLEGVQAVGVAEPRLERRLPNKTETNGNHRRKLSIPAANADWPRGGNRRLPTQTTSAALNLGDQPTQEIKMINCCATVVVGCPFLNV